MADGLLLASPAASWLGMAAGATGITIPAGDPGDLRKAAAAWGHVEEALARQAQVVERAALTAALADWQGIASIAFESRSRALCVDLRRSARACRQAATACKRLAVVLRDAQEDAREATRQAFDALDRITRAERLIDGARADAAVADQQVTEARAAGEIARNVPGGLGAAGAQMAQAREQEAHHEGRAARGRLARASELLEDARRDLRRAQRHGDEANRRAAEAGRGAAGALADVAAAARRAPQPAARPAVPITPGAGGHGGLLDAVLAIVNPTVPIGTVRTPGLGNVDLNTTAGDIAGNGLTGQLAGAAARAEDARAEALRRFPLSVNPAHDPLTRGQHANLSRERMNKVRNHEIRVERTVTRATKVLRGTSSAVSAVNAALQARDNQKKGMPLLENGLRTGLSTVVGSAGAALGATLCSPSVVGAIGCGAVGGYAGSKAGDAAGGIAYKVVDEVAQRGIKPLVGAAGKAADAVGDAVDAGLGKVGVHP